jgi:predicted flap endonuclease-1-like 5' DNA nuclease
MAKLEDIEGIGSMYAVKLRAAGVRSIGDLLKKGSTSKGRKEIAQNAGITEKLVLEWANHADLFRVSGVGSEYSDLLEEAGVDTVPELAQRNSKGLYETLVKVNASKKLVRQLPGADKVADWITQAKKLPRIIQY